MQRKHYRPIMMSSSDGPLGDVCRASGLQLIIRRNPANADNIEEHVQQLANIYMQSGASLVHANTYRTFAVSSQRTVPETVPSCGTYAKARIRTLITIICVPSYANLPTHALGSLIVLYLSPTQRASNGVNDYDGIVEHVTIGNGIRSID